MHIEEQLQKAVGQFDWPTVKGHLEAVDPLTLRSWAANFLDVILRDGYLILRRPDEKAMKKRDSFLAELRRFLHDRQIADLLDERSDQFTSSANSEMAFQEILASFRKDLLAHISPEELAWASIRSVEAAEQEMVTRIKAGLSNIKHMVDPMTVRLPVDSDGTPARPDGVLKVLQSTLTATLKMLAYTNRWFDRDGILVLPTPVPTTEKHENIARGSIFLATVWKLVERSDGRCRYFNGLVTRQQIEFQELDSPEKNLHTGDAVCFEFNNDLEVELHAAGERLQRMLFNFFVNLYKDPEIVSKVVLAPPIPPATQAYVSVEEAHGVLSLSHLLFKPVVEITTTFAELTLSEWIRGYAVVQKLARGYSQSLKGAEEPVLVEEADIIKALTEHGLPEDKARVFFRHATFGKGSDDVFDAPFVRCQDGRFCFIIGAAAHLNPTFVVISQLSSLRCNMSWKGKPFEANTIELFQTHGIEATAIHRRMDGEEIEIDCVAIWDNILFVIECKNYFMPSDNPQSEFWFLQDQVAAASQVMRKVRAIEAYPEMVGDALGKKVTWSRIVPIVLNGSPFSLPGPIQDVYFYDSSALHRFFEEGYIAYSVDGGGNVAPRPISESTKQLWSGARPSAQDFLQQLEKPVQVVQAIRLFDRVVRAAPLSRHLFVQTRVIERLPSTIADMAAQIGMTEAELLNSLGAN